MIGFTKPVTNFIKPKEPEPIQTVAEDVEGDKKASVEARRKARAIAAQQQQGGRGGALLASGGAGGAAGRKRTLLGA